MDKVYLSTICAGVLLLVTAFALGLPSLKPDVPMEKTALLRIAAPEQPAIQQKTRPRVKTVPEI